MKAERFALLVVLVFAIGLPLVAVLATPGAVLTAPCRPP